MPSTPVVVLDSTLTDIADAIRGKNGSSDTYKPSEMPAAITAIPSGGGVGIPREVSTQGVFQMPSQSFTFSLPANATDVGSYAFSYAFSGSGLTSIDLGSLTTVSGANAFSYAFRDCAGLTSINFSSLTTVSGANAFSYAFRDCAGLTSVNFSSLTTVSGANAFNNIFRDCAGLTSVNLSSLTTVSGDSAFYGAFYSCFRLTSIYFPALTPNSFGSYTNQFLSMLGSVSGCTVHFPASTQAKIETMSGYPNFGGANTTVLFDL